MTDTTEDTKRTVQGVELPACASQPLGWGEAWYYEIDGVLHAHQGDNSAEGERAEAMLADDLTNDQVVMLEAVDVDELPTQFRTYATDGGER